MKTQVKLPDGKEITAASKMAMASVQAFKELSRSYGDVPSTTAAEEKAAQHILMNAIRYLMTKEFYGFEKEAVNVLGKLWWDFEYKEIEYLKSLGISINIPTISGLL